MALIPLLGSGLHAAEYDTLAIREDSLQIQEDTIVQSRIVESRVTRRADRDVYTILPSDRLKSYDINSLLDQIPGVSYDRISGKLTVNGQESVVFEMDGMEVSEEELRSLSPEQIRSVSIIHTPKGRYISRGVRYVIEIGRKRNDGVLVSAVNSMFIAPETVSSTAPRRGFSMLRCTAM